jgi:hypothetical protein
MPLLTPRRFKVTIENKQRIRFFSGRPTRLYSLALAQANQLKEGFKKGYSVVIVEL